MRILLTHEQADFDALASLLGAHMLDEDAIAVLPRRMNRNVRAFVTLYGVELPFVDPRDMPNKPVIAVTLVDTQSMVSIKGMSAATKVQVIDHHPRRDDLPADWSLTSDDTGASATLFVEALRERESDLTTVHATLLLLGIYEDTGSLTYTRTTPRDLNAAAYLLERGASLQIAADFLNHPLSLQQQALYDRLRANAQSHHIHGHTIIVASGDALDVGEELSSVAHKIRDLLDPDALFLLVTVRGGVQMIARSTNDQIDVAQIADQFGGGGHERAAAALVKDRDLEQVCAELLSLLPARVHPAVTVAQIMSGEPQVLAPETLVEEAARRMQRYGYEGYPVVKNGRVVGLLTRRAVDRALSHKMPKTAASLMEAGEYFVHPADSVERLQHLMTESGWGQIPVVQPETGRIVGIVTRTDLLKTLTRERRLPGSQNLASRLESALPPARLMLLRAAAQAAFEVRSALYIVGGFVRDLLLERPSLDFDLVVEGDAIELARRLARQFGGRVTSHTRFSTAKWHIAADKQGVVERLSRFTESEPRAEAGDGGPAVPEGQVSHLSVSDLPETLDLVSARTEFYTHPTALPTVERGSIKLDLHRRDFTINTLALRLDGRHYGELYDYWGGLNDLRHGQMRVLHSLSFVDDPTRMLRAVRFEQRFGFQIDARTLELLREARPLLDRISGDRIRNELNHILAEEQASAALSRLNEQDLLSAIHPDLLWDAWLCDRIASLVNLNPEPYWQVEESHKPGEKGSPTRQVLALMLWLVRLPPTRARKVATRLKIPHLLTNEIIAACTLRRDLPTLAAARPSQVVTRLDGLPSRSIYAVHLACDEAHLRSILVSYASRWRQVAPLTNGHALRARGLSPGPIYRQILGALREAWLDERITSFEEEQALVEQLIRAASQVSH